MAPVLAAFAVAIGVPILLFYVYGVVPVSLCRAGCGVSTRDGFKFDLDEEEYTRTRNHQQDAASVDAVSRIGATSIGEVSLSVASGPLSAFNRDLVATALHSNRESTTALAGSIGQPTHRLEVQADVTSDTASTQDAASTRALAGSIFQDHLGADKLSLCSGRSMRSSERSYRDEMDSMSLSSGHKRMVLGQRMCMEIKETCDEMAQHQDEEEEEEQTGTSLKAVLVGGEERAAEEEGRVGDVALESIVISTVMENQSQQPQTSIIHIQLSKAAAEKASKSGDEVDGEEEEEADHNVTDEGSNSGEGPSSKSKTAILRNIFFSQIATASSSPAATINAKD